MSKMYKMLKVNSEKEKNGIWIAVDCGDENPWKFKITYQGKRNKKYNLAMRELVKPVQHAAKNNMLSPSEEMRITISAFIKGILLDWSGVVDESGKTLPFNFENALRVLTVLPAIYDQLEEDSNDLALFRDDELKAESKN